MIIQIIINVSLRIYKQNEILISSLKRHYFHINTVTDIIHINFTNYITDTIYINIVMNIIIN